MSKLYKPARPLEVRVDARGLPVMLRWRGMLYSGNCLNHWRIRTRWWAQEVLRDYYLWESHGLLCEIYHDAKEGLWYMHRIYD